ncbi:PH domain-containing protein [Adlercreutzia sp. ZJ138]|uniref:PH domain-containing protein n=1 Tax=Adlercreutzia sp. ZJ138 TaxID=2709405 RepID=UPI0013EC7C1C|nr:PH domain-containing protein [Adlercreutzia sp. ZJ138]
MTAEKNPQNAATSVPTPMPIPAHAAASAHAQTTSPVPASFAPAQTTSPTPTPEWEAYRAAVFAAANDTARDFPNTDPRASVPESLRPGQHHVHHAYIWLGGLSTVAAIAVAGIASTIGSLIPALSSIGSAGTAPLVTIGISLLIGILAFAVICGIVGLIQWLSWKNLTFELSPTEFSLFSGIISKKRLHVPYQRVQAVNQQAGVLQRLLGLCTVKIDTAGGASNDAVMLKYVRNSDAEALRAELFRRKKVLLAEGELDQYGNARVQGAVVPSAWMIACTGGDMRAAMAVLGASMQPAAPQASPVSAASAVSMREDASLQLQTPGTPPTPAPFPSANAPGAGPTVDAYGNVLDAIDDVLSDVRGVFGGAHVATGTVTYETGLSNKELVFAGASGAGSSFGIILVGVLGIVGFCMEFFESAIASWLESSLGETMANVSASSATDALSSLFSAAAWSLAAWIALGVVAVWLLSAAGTIVRYGGFKVRRRESRIEVEHGLLQRTFHGVDIDRVQSVIIKQSFIRRCIGYCELSLGKIDSVTRESQNGEQTATPSDGIVVHPFVKTSRVPEILQGIAPELADLPRIIAKPAPVARRRAIIRKGVIRSASFWLAVCAAIGLVALNIAVGTGAWDITASAEDAVALAALRTVAYGCFALFALSFVVNTIDAVLWHRHSGIGYNERFMVVVNGGLASKTVALPRKKLQFASTKTNPFQRAAHVQTVAARTAAGVSGTTELIWDLSNADAEAWMDWARPGGNRQSPPISQG